MSAQPHIVLVSVVRDFAMYEKCVGKGNPYTHACERYPLDNRERNAGVPVGYNAFLDSRPVNEEAWYVFCHEDFQFLEDVPAIFCRHNPSPEVLWGPIGAATQVRFGMYHQWQLRGHITESRKDGSAEHTVGTPVPVGTPVETFDCQCLIVHSSLVHRHHLRFDDNLTFDLYTEEFCMSAHENQGIASRILPFTARHWSGGALQPRYYDQERYVTMKYPTACYTGTSSWILGGAPTWGRRLTVAAKKAMRRIRSV